MEGDPNNLQHPNFNRVEVPVFSNELRENKELFTFNSAGNQVTGDLASRTDKATQLRKGPKDNTGRRGSADKERLLKRDIRVRLRDDSYMDMRGLRDGEKSEESEEEYGDAVGMSCGDGGLGDGVAEGGGEGQSEPPWKIVESKSVDKIIRRTEKRLLSFDKRWKSSNFTARFEAVDAKGEVIKSGFHGISMLKTYAGIRSSIPSCRLRVDTEASVLLVTVDSQDDVPAMRSLSEFGGVKARLISSETPRQCWGRINGVPIEILEAEMLAVLEETGVKEVKREKFYVNEVKDGQTRRVERQSQRVRLRFEGVPPEKVDLGFPEKFSVALVFEEAPQCYACHRFNHRVEQCTKKDTPLCRGCGQPGHQMWHCPNDPKCVNCGRQHHARYPDCPVYLRYVEATKVRQLNRMVVDNPGVVVDFIKEPALGEGAPASAASLPGVNQSALVESQPGLTYARVVSLRQGDVPLCRIPVAHRVQKRVKPTGKGKPGTPAPRSINVTPGKAKSEVMKPKTVEEEWRSLELAMAPLVRQHPVLAAMMTVFKTCYMSILKGDFSASARNDVV